MAGPAGELPHSGKYAAWATIVRHHVVAWAAGRSVHRQELGNGGLDPDPRTITVFTTPPIGPPVVTDLLKAAAMRIPGTTVVPADFAGNVNSSGDRNTYIFGTGGWLRYEVDQQRSTLEKALRTVADLIVERGFLVAEPLDIEDSVK